MGVDLPVQLLNHRAYENIHVEMRSGNRRANSTARADWLQHLQPARHARAERE